MRRVDHDAPDVFALTSTLQGVHIISAIIFAVVGGGMVQVEQIAEFFDDHPVKHYGYGMFTIGILCLLWR